MRQLARQILLLTLTFGSVASVGLSQVLTFDSNITPFVAADGFANGYALANETTFTQTFTGISSFDTFTLRFIAADSATFATGGIDTYFSAWAGANATTPASLVGLASYADSASWTDSGDGYIFFDSNVDLSAIGALTPANTYGLTLLGNPDSAAGGIRIAGSTDLYPDGSVYTHSPVVDPVMIQLMAGGGAAGGAGFNFTAGEFSPIPEASTITVLFAGAFVSGMIGLRLRKRRQQKNAEIAAV
ncbi:MAG: hypothetical protein ABII82_08075 [Verrucomicrobiota bacterium]